MNAVDSETNELFYTTLEPTASRVIAHAFFAELREKHDVDDVPGNRSSVKHVFREIKRRITSFLDCFSDAEVDTDDDRLRLTTADTSCVEYETAVPSTVVY